MGRKGNIIKGGGMEERKSRSMIKEVVKEKGEKKKKGWAKIKEVWRQERELWGRREGRSGGEM